MTKRTDDAIATIRFEVAKVMADRTDAIDTLIAVGAWMSAHKKVTTDDEMFALYSRVVSTVHKLTGEP